jgi:lipoate-protein ligase A
MHIRWINAGRVNHYRSQSIYHGLAYALSPETPITVVVSIPADPYICIGYFQDAAKEVDLEFCRQNKLPVIRRETGGGTVYIDSGQIFIQWICQPGFLPRKVEQRFQLFNKALIETYSFFGIAAYHYPVNDVHVDGKKIVGTGAATIGDAEVVTGNFLFDFNVGVMSQSLNITNDELRTAIHSSMENYITWMNRELKSPPTYEELIDQYKIQCERILSATIQEGFFSQKELELINQWENKVQQYDWLHSVKSTKSKNRLVKIHAGVWVGLMVHEQADLLVQVFSQMRNGVLDKLKFYLSVTPSWDVEKLEQSLISSVLEMNIIKSRVEQFFLSIKASERLITIEDWTEAIMKIKKEVQKVSGQ